MAFFSIKPEEVSFAAKFVSDVHEEIRTNFLRLVDISASPEYKLYVELDGDNRSGSQKVIAQSTREIVCTLWPLVNESLQRLSAIKEASDLFQTRSRRKMAELEIKHMNAVREDNILLDLPLPSYAIHRLTCGKVTRMDNDGRFYTSVHNIANCLPRLLARIERNLKALQDGQTETDALVAKDLVEADWDAKYPRPPLEVGGLRIYI